MKRCKECNKLADSGDKRCQYCGTPFEHATPYSEINLFFGLLLIAMIGLIIWNAIHLKLPDPAECSGTSLRRYEKIAEQYYKDTKNVLRQEMITSRQLSELASYKYDARDMPLPACLEPARGELVAYLEDVYYIALFSVWGSYRASAAKTESAGAHWESFNTLLDQVRACAPNCP